MELTGLRHLPIMAGSLFTGETRMKRLLAFALVCAFSCCLHAQVVDATVCDILKNPPSFDGKIVRIKGTVTAGLDQFVIKGADCGELLNGIWLSYPEGTKAKAGPAAFLQLQPARNFAGTVTPVERKPVTLEKTKDFKQFDSLLSAPYKGSGMCLACARNEVSATLIGRLDGTKAELRRNAEGKIVAISGFGNRNVYSARLVLQSVSDVAPQEIDYSKIVAVTKGEVLPEASGDPVAATHKAALAFGPSSAPGDAIERGAAAFGKQGEDNGVNITFGIANEVMPGLDAKGATDSPDGVLFNAKFDMARLKKNELVIAIPFTGTEIADIRNPKSAGSASDVFDMETHAWQAATFCAIANGLKTLTLPGGYMVWNNAWSATERDSLADSTFRNFIAHQELMSQ
jgi:hypothetical protein